MHCLQFSRLYPFCHVRKLLRFADIRVFRGKFVVAVGFHPGKGVVNHLIGKMARIWGIDSNGRMALSFLSDKKGTQT
jgi:hypothetical protein